MENNSDFVIENGVLTRYNSPGGDVTIPQGVTSIGEGAFFSCVTLTSVTIPEGVTTIKDRTFNGCAALISIAIPKSVTVIKAAAFAGCASLTSVTIPKSVTGIDKSVFEGSHPVLIAPHIPVADFDRKNKPGACAGFARRYLEKTELDEEVKVGYLKYIKGQKKRLYPTAVRHGELLRVMFTEKMVPRRDIDLLLDECDKQNNAAARAAVLEYADKSLKPVDPLKEFKLGDL